MSGCTHTALPLIDVMFFAQLQMKKFRTRFVKLGQQPLICTKRVRNFFICNSAPLKDFYLPIKQAQPTAAWTAPQQDVPRAAANRIHVARASSPWLILNTAKMAVPRGLPIDYIQSSAALAGIGAADDLNTGKTIINRPYKTTGNALPLK